MEDPLAVYLHDHLAGSSFAVELLEKLASEFTATPSGDVARELLEEVQIDRKTLEQLIAKVGKVKTDLYDALGWIAERVSRIKLKHDDPSGIGAFESFETISIGILGKRALWEALQVRQKSDSRIAGLDYPGLIARAEQQFQKANQYRLDLIQDALGKQEGRYPDDGRPHRHRGVRPVWPASKDWRPRGQRLVVFPGGDLDSALWRRLLGAAAHRRNPMKQAVLGTGLVLAPLAWFGSLEANFALAPLACAGHGKSMLLLVSAAASGLAVASGLLAWTQRNFHRCLAISGAVVSALFSIVIVAQAIPNLMLGGCE